MGYAIASHLARYEHLRRQIRLLCQNKATCLNFAKKGIDVHQIDYTHPHQLSVAMRGVDQLILAVGHEKDRVLYAEHLCDMAAKSGIQSIICISHVGAVSDSHESLQQYALIEDFVINSDLQWTILRPDWVHQQFHLWAPYVEKYRRWPLPMPDNAEICPIDISDVCKVVEELVLDTSSKTLRALDDYHVDQVYTLTGPQAVTGKQLVDLLTKATGFQKFEYQLTRAMDLGYYLHDLKKDIWFDARIKQENAQIYRDTLDGYAYRSKSFGPPTATQIQTYLDYFDWVTKTASSICVPHASLITSLPSRPIRKFFQENANSFKPRV
ncbi:hypothetical protein EC973_004767 [Apophysomyces ossiformis]|uniref:NAD(P)-binding domain-containing protein n=1 Tax=Apophysomyces ossiformis TaxID=679940 RepID=A0A8H7BS57_9FUNG|nr:hypothetical protein EC973_004767 [Apophysomyces ossiformis]